MASRDITLWIDERWYEALEQNGIAVEDKLNEFIDILVNQLPEDVYKRVSHELWEDEQERLRVQEAKRRFAVFKVKERGEESCYLVEEPLDFLRAARSLRRYLRAENSPGDFRHYYAAARDISTQEFFLYAMERIENTGRVCGVFEVDIDRGEFASLGLSDGWKLYTVKDVCAAAYRATQKQHMADSYYQRRFAEHLDGKAISPTFGEPKITMEQIM